MMELLKMVCGVGWACIELVSDLVDGPQKKEEKHKRKKKKYRESWYSEEERITIERKRSYGTRIDSIVPGGIGVRRGSGHVRDGLVAGAETPGQPGTGPVRAGTGATHAPRAW